MPFGVIVGVMAVCWVLAMVACFLSLRWTRVHENRFVPALISAIIALSISWMAMRRFHIKASKAVNGETSWSLNSKWWFLASFLLSIAVLAYAFWKRWKRSGSNIPVP